MVKGFHPVTILSGAGHKLVTGKTWKPLFPATIFVKTSTDTMPGSKSSFSVYTLIILLLIVLLAGIFIWQVFESRISKIDQQIEKQYQDK